MERKPPSSKSGRLKWRLIPFVKDENVYNSLYKCHYCGEILPYDKITVDHKVPKKNGGRNNAKNLLPACAKCNRRKGGIKYDLYIKFLKK